ncbi:MAG: efflux RND transporter periplasmic adaptor subunit [Myxococcota bacterium]
MRRGRAHLAVLALSAAAACSAEAPPADAPPVAAPRVEASAPLRVRVAQVESSAVGAGGEVAVVVEPLRSATVAAEVGARVVERHVEPGAFVEAGAPLVTLDTELLGIAVDEARAARAARAVDLAEAKRELARGEELEQADALSRQRYDALRFGVERATSAERLAAAALRRAERARADAVVRAPFAGTVESVAVQVGDYLAPGQPVAVVADLAQVRLKAGVTAEEAAELAPGLPARVSLAGLGGKPVSTTIQSVGGVADATTGTYPVELWLENADRRLRGGMVGQALLAPRADTDAIVVPRAAVLRRAGALVVFRVEGDGDAQRARLQPVQVGRGRGERVEIRHGLEAGQQVVVEGHFALTDGASVQVDAQIAEDTASSAAQAVRP